MTKKQSYDNESIVSLKDEERVRKRPAVIFGSDGIEGCEHSVFEIVSNSIDEAREGFGHSVEMTRHADHSVTVRDFGRGIPVDYNTNEKRFNWELVFCELYAGGKFNNNDSGSFTFSLGLNGLGLCATQYASEYMDVEIHRDGHKYTLHFEKGKNVGGLRKTGADGAKTGTSITWRPDREVFTDIAISLDFYKAMLKRQAIVNAGLLFKLHDEESGESFEFRYENGIRDYISEIVTGGLTEPVFWEYSARGRDREDKPEYDLKCQIAFCFGSQGAGLEYYHNSSWLEHGGSPDKAARAALTAAVDAYIRNANGYKKDDKKITFADIEDGLTLISSSFSTLTSFENQTKKAITNKFIQDSMTEFLKKQLQIYFIENKADADKIAAQVLVNKKSRESAETARINIKKKLTGAIDLSNRVEKFVNCRSKDVSIRELYIVEGDSALTSCQLARDAAFQAIIPVRGKILNCLKSDYEKIFANDIIVDLLRVLGCGVEIKSRHSKDINSFELEKLNWSKVIICTDADVDGFQIRTLILTMLYRLVPTLIEAGKVFIAESPLYEITCKGQTYFAYSDAEKAEITKKLTGKTDIQRSKGLGENEPEMMWLTTMNPETRRLVAVLPGDAEKGREMFDVLLGDKLKERKEFIENFGYKYIDLTETV